MQCKVEANVQNVTFYRWNDMEKEKVTDLLDRRLITGAG